MCNDSSAEGQNVLIDTSGADVTEKITKTALCTCKTNIQYAKFYNMTLRGVDGICNAYIKVNLSNGHPEMKTDENCKKKEFSFLSADEMFLSLLRRSEDSDVDFCINISIS